jgi:hypothetical protein
MSHYPYLKWLFFIYTEKKIILLMLMSKLFLTLMTTIFRSNEQCRRDNHAKSDKLWGFVNLNMG